jgi:ABC-type ATPase involved in cell division
MLAERFPHAGVDASTRVLEAFERVGLGVHVEHRPTVLSSGERRRAEIAALLVRAPRAILADEPLRNLSPIDADAVAQLFRALAETGAAVIISGHETETLFSVAHHITWCTSGTTLELGSPERARQYEQFRREYLCGVQSDIG